MWSALNCEVPADDLTCSDARRRIQARLGEYAALIVAPLNLRPTAATLLAADDERIEVRVSTPGANIVLVIAPDGDLAPEIFFLRMLAEKFLPVPRLIAHDLACTLVPFTYAIESYAGGAMLDRLDNGPLMRVAARQIGRTLRRAHQIAAPGFGRPTTSGRWPARGWRETLATWLAQRETPARAAEVLGASGLDALWAATLDHPSLEVERPRVIHGAVEPARALVTVGDSAQLENLPMNGRNFMEAAQLEPGVQIQDGGNFDPTKIGYAGISIGGRQGRTTRIEVDGLDITDETVGTTVDNELRTDPQRTLLLPSDGSGDGIIHRNNFSRFD